MTKTERNAEIYAKYCAGARYARLGLDYDLTDSGIKQVLAKVRRERGIVKVKGKRQ